MDDLGASIFHDLRRSIGIPEIAAKLARELNISACEIAQEIRRFLEALHTQGLFAEEAPSSPVCPKTLQPRSLYLHLTARCNLRCVYCYNRKERENWQGDMPFSLAKRVLSQAKEMGIPAVVLTGGEPLLNPEAPRIGEFAKELGLHVTLLTNGIPVDESKARALAQICDQIVVSLDSRCPAIHDALRGQGTHARAVQAVRRLKEAGAQEVAIAGVITRLNQSERFEEFERFARGIGADQAVRQIYMLQGDERDQLFVPDFQVLLQRMDEDLEKTVVEEEPAGADAIWRNRCSAAFGEIAVDPQGTVYPCQGLINPAFRAGNIIAADLAEIWTKSDVLAKVRAITVEDIPRCCACPFRYLCGGGCRALAYTAFRSLTAPIPEGYCAFNRILAEGKLWKAALSSKSR